MVETLLKLVQHRLGKTKLLQCPRSEGTLLLALLRQMGGRDEMIKASINLQVLQRRIYTKAITLGVKSTRKSSMGESYAGFDEVGAGNGLTEYRAGPRPYS